MQKSTVIEALGNLPGANLLAPFFNTRSGPIPIVDQDYVFNPQLFYRIANRISSNSKRVIYLTGKQGCGKSSLPMQIAARLGQPLIFTNIHEDIRRQDLIGYSGLSSVNNADDFHKMTKEDLLSFLNMPDPSDLKKMTEDQLRKHAKQTLQGTITKFIDGPAALAFRNGWWLLLDEVDLGSGSFGPSINDIMAYSDLYIGEAKQIIKPDSNTRIFVTANTSGMGDSSGMLQGRKQQDASYLSRSVFIRVDYLPPELEAPLLANKMCDTFTSKGFTQQMAISVSNTYGQKIAELASAMRSAYLNDQVSEPLTTVMSTREAIIYAEAIAGYCNSKTEIGENAVELASRDVLYDRLDPMSAELIAIKQLVETFIPDLS